MDSKSTLCPEPFMQVMVGPDGTYKLCCIAINSRGADSIGHIRQHTTSQHFASDRLNEIRKQMQAGDRSSLKRLCGLCYRSEDTGSSSRRTRLFSWPNYSGFNPDYPRLVTLQFELGNICNLKCRMCEPHYSNRIAKEFRALGWLGNEYDFDEDGIIRGFEPTAEFLADLRRLVPQLRYLRFTGGEPFINPKHKLILSAIEDLDLSHLNVLYITNGQYQPQYTAWPRFKSVHIKVSIDDLGPRGEYIRRGSSTARTISTLRHYRDQRSMILTTNSVIQAFNALSITDLIDYLSSEIGIENVGLDILLYPHHLSVEVLPREIRRLACDKIQNWLAVRSPPGKIRGILESVVQRMISTPLQPDQWHAFLEYNFTLDKSRTLLFSLFPEFLADGPPLSEVVK